MVVHVVGRLLKEAAGLHRYGRRAAPVQRLVQRLTPSGSVRSFSDQKDEAQPPFDTSLLDFLVCPLSKKPLRYEAKTNELINEELGIAYPITDGIPNMIPQEARLLQKDPETSTTS